jgi:hypothetical protein
MGSERQAKGEAPMITPTTLHHIGRGWQICICEEEENQNPQGFRPTRGRILYITRVEIRPVGPGTPERALVDYLELSPRDKHGSRIDLKRGSIPFRNGVFHPHEIRDVSLREW